MDDDVGVEAAAFSEGDVGLDDAEGADFDVVADFCIGRDDCGRMNGHGGLADVGDAFVAKKIACVNTSLDELPLAVEVEAEGGEVFLGPLVGSDHGEDVLLAHAVEVVGFADGGFELDVGLVDELVPVEVLDGGDVFPAHFLELVAEVFFDLAEAAGFEGGEVVGDDPGAEGGDGVGHEGAGPGLFRDEFVHVCLLRWQRSGLGQLTFSGP